MCLQTTWLEPKIAEEDILVYKEVRYYHDTYYAVYHNFIYELGVCYETEIEEVTDTAAFDDIANDWKHSLEDNSIDYKSIGPGFHSALDRDRVGYGTVLECLIPKGALYYKDGTGLIVSNKLQPIKRYTYVPSNNMEEIQNS